MAYTDIIEFDDQLRYGTNVVEFGLYGSPWNCSTSWANIGNSIVSESFSNNEYFIVDSHAIHPQVTIKKRGLYHVYLLSSFCKASNSQLGWCGIFINDPNFSNSPKFFSTCYTHQYVYQGKASALCGGFVELNDGDIIKAAVSRSGLSGSLECTGLDRCRVAHVFDLAD